MERLTVHRQGTDRDLVPVEQGPESVERLSIPQEALGIAMDLVEVATRSDLHVMQPRGLRTLDGGLDGLALPDPAHDTKLHVRSARRDRASEVDGTRVTMVSNSKMVCRRYAQVTSDPFSAPAWLWLSSVATWSRETMDGDLIPAT